MKTITLRELRKRGIEKGDIFYSENYINDGHTGWRLAITDKFNVGLNTPIIGSWGENHRQVHNKNSKLTKIILSETIENSVTFENLVASFLRTFDEKYVREYITIVNSEPTYISGVHFGSSKEYFWRVPEDMFHITIDTGDLVLVDTKYGEQVVKVKRIFTSDKLGNDYKQVLDIVRV